MLRCFVFGVCLACWTLATGLADEPTPCCELPGVGHLPPDIWSCPLQGACDESVMSRPATREPGRGLPQSEHDFLARQDPPVWVPQAQLPSFQIFEDPIPSPLILTHSGTCLAPCCQKAKAVAVPKPRYNVVAQAGPAVVTVSDEAPAPAFSNLTVPMPLADPAAMVVQLFEKLEAAEHRATEATRRLAEAEAELAGRPHAPVAVPAGPSTAASEGVVTLQLQCFEIDLDAVAKSNVELAGICKHALSEKGLAALVAGGAFADCCSAKATCSPHPGCSQESAPIAAPPAPAKKPCCVESHQYVEDEQRLAGVVDDLMRAGLLHHISRPRLMTRSGETARMTVGRQIAYRASGENGNAEAQQVSFCTAGTEIEVRPTVAPGCEDGTVQVELSAHWTAIDEAATRENGQPIIKRHSVDSIIELPAGKTAVVASLVEHATADATVAYVERVGVPVPGADRLFKNVGIGTSAESHRREFVVLVTPRLVAPVAAATANDVTR